MSSVERPVALITGAAQGIGRATAEEFARRQYDLALWDVEEELLAAVASRLRQSGTRVHEEAGDLADLAFAEQAVARSLAACGHIDVLVNNAAWRELVTLRRISLASWERTLRICLTAPAFVSRWVAAAMEPRQGGVIVNISSIMSGRSAGDAPAYVAAEGGLDALTREMATLYGRSGIRVVGIQPGAVDTELSRDYRGTGGEDLTGILNDWSEDAIPQGRWAQPEEIARAIAWVASPEASYLHGTSLVLDGGWTAAHLPYSLRRRLDPDAPA